MKVVILNDTGICNHFGCRLTMMTYREQLDRVGIELIGTVSMGQHWNQHREMLDKADLVIVNGEGSIHHGKRGELIEVAKEYPSILMNCVYQDNPYKTELLNFKKIYVRESESQRAMTDRFIVADIVPDIVFTSSMLQDRVICRIKARQCRNIGIVDSVLPGKAGISAWCSPEQFINEITKCDGICTGRFHGIVLCAVLGIPFAAYATNTHKNIGILKDMKSSHLYADDQHDALMRVPRYVNHHITEYVSVAQTRINLLFENLHEF